MIEPDPINESQVMGDPQKEPTDEERDQSDEKRTEAVKAFSEQQFDEAIKLYTEAIQLNPQSALLFAKRGQVCMTSFLVLVLDVYCSPCYTSSFPILTCVNVI